MCLFAYYVFSLVKCLAQCMHRTRVSLTLEQWLIWNSVFKHFAVRIWSVTHTELTGRPGTYVSSYAELDSVLLRISAIWDLSYYLRPHSVFPSPLPRKTDLSKFSLPHRHTVPRSQSCPRPTSLFRFRLFPPVCLWLTFQELFDIPSRVLSRDQWWRWAVVSLVQLGQH